MTPLVRLALAVCLAAVFILAGCGGTANPAPAPTPKPPSPPAPGAPAPATAPTTFSYNLAYYGRPFFLPGTIVVDATADDGAGTIAVTGLTPASTYNVSFCPYAAACIAVAQFTTDAQGNVKLQFKFPRAGTWSGIFELVNPASNQTIFSGTIAGVGAPKIAAHFVRAAAVTGGLGTYNLGNDPLGWAVITVDSDNNTTMEVHGAAAGVSYQVVQCVATPGAGADCQPVGALITDSTGFGTAGFALQASDPSVFIILRNNAAEFASGFLVQ